MTNKPCICNVHHYICYFSESAGIETTESQNHLNHDSTEDNEVDSAQSNFKPLPLIQCAHMLLFNPLWQGGDLIIYN